MAKLILDYFDGGPKSLKQANTGLGIWGKVARMQPLWRRKVAVNTLGHLQNDLTCRAGNVQGHVKEPWGAHLTDSSERYMSNPILIFYSLMGIGGLCLLI